MTNHVGRHDFGLPACGNCIGHRFLDIGDYLQAIPKAW